VTYYSQNFTIYNETTPIKKPSAFLNASTDLVEIQSIQNRVGEQRNGSEFFEVIPNGHYKIGKSLKSLVYGIK
jgi:hypothetical protein